MDDHGYEATVGAIHPGGNTVAIGGGVSGHLETLDHYYKKTSVETNGFINEVETIPDC